MGNDDPQACTFSSLPRGGFDGAGYVFGRWICRPMIRLLLFLSLLFLVGAQSRASGWQAEWLAAVGRGVLAAPDRLALPETDVGLADRKGKTALMVAASKGDAVLVGKLLALAPDAV